MVNCRCKLRINRAALRMRSGALPLISRTSECGKCERARVRVYVAKVQCKQFSSCFLSPFILCDFFFNLDFLQTIDTSYSVTYLNFIDVFSR